MTDRDKLINLLSEFGVGFEAHETNKYILCMQGKEKIDGYLSFYTVFDFDEDGKFINMGAWK